MAMLTREATEALRKRLAEVKKREDVEVLGVLGVRPEWVQDWISLVPGLSFKVAYTFTSGRRQRRIQHVGFRTHSNGGDYSAIRLPPVLLQFLTDAVAGATPEVEVYRLDGTAVTPGDKVPDGQFSAEFLGAFQDVDGEYRARIYGVSGERDVLLAQVRLTHERQD